MQTRRVLPEPLWWHGAGEHAAVDHEFGAGDITRRVGGEIEHGLLYGMATAGMALLTGWFASVVFRRE